MLKGKFKNENHVYYYVKYFVRILNWDSGQVFDLYEHTYGLLFTYQYRSWGDRDFLHRGQRGLYPQGYFEKRDQHYECFY